MQCKKCRREIPEGSLYCNYCGRKQETAKRKKAKRAHSTGTVRVRGDCKKNPYIAYAPSTPNGAGRKYLGSYPSMAAAQQALESYAKGAYSELSGARVDKIYDLWSAKHFQTLSRSGEQSYKTAYKWLAPIKSAKMADIKTADLQRCIDACAAKFGRAQCEKVRQLCSQLCKFAMQNDVINKNYAEFVKLPREESKEKKIFSDEQIAKLWDCSADSRVQCILIMIYTGFRIGEICDIKRENVDLEGRYIIAGEKTEAGIDRFVPIQSDIYPFVAALYEQSDGRDRLINLTVKAFRNNVFYAALAELGMIAQPTVSEKTGKLEYKDPAFTPHCTRHTFASLCVRSGMKPEHLKKIIGHAKYETTADIYVHEDRAALSLAMGALKRNFTEPITEPMD